MFFGDISLRYCPAVNQSSTMISQLSTLNSVKRFGTDVRYLRWSTYIHFVRTVGGRCVGRSITGYTYDPIHVCSLLMTVSFLFFGDAPSALVASLVACGCADAKDRCKRRAHHRGACWSANHRNIFYFIVDTRIRRRCGGAAG